MVQCSCVHYGLCIIIATEYHEQVANHSCLFVVVKFYNLFCRELVKRHLHHRDCSFYYFLTCLNDGIGLLATQHDCCNLWGVCQIIDTSLNYLNTCQGKAFVELLF